MIVSVIGACGHVGFPFSVVVADSGHTVYGIDINSGLCARMNGAYIPFIEKGIAAPFLMALGTKQLTFTTKTDSLIKSDVVAIMIGTPVDSENNPRLDELHNFIKFELCDHIKKGQLIVLRSTVCPGTTEIVRDMIEKETRLTEGVDFHLVFCPERVAQGHGFEECKKFPQIVGAFNESGYRKAKEFFKTFVENDCFWLTPREAEIGKLVTNMYRYVNFALANEFYMIAEKQDVDIHRVIEACNKDYPRMNLPLPGPNVGGPCLFKDGRFLLENVPYADLINTSFLINEGMPDYIFSRIKEMHGGILPDKRILILGMTFKADCDDTRNSLSYKMKKAITKNGCEAVCYDPYVIGIDKESENYLYDAVILMTPHDYLKKWLTDSISFLQYDTVIVDIWKHFPESKTKPTGIYRVSNVTDPRHMPALSEEEEKMYKEW